MIINKNDLLSMIQEEVIRQNKRKALNQRILQIENEIDKLDNNSILLKEFIGAEPGMTPEGTPEQQKQTEKESLSMYKIRAGEIYVLDFQGLDNFKITKARMNDEVFRVIDKSTSKHMQVGDEFKINGAHRFEKGKEYDFVLISRVPGQVYHTNPLLSWTKSV